MMFFKQEKLFENLQDGEMNSCKHVPDKEVTGFEDAWYGSRKIGNYESGYEYKPILCALCGSKIKANKNLTEWQLQEECGDEKF